MYLKQQQQSHIPRGIYPGNANKLVNIWKWLTQSLTWASYVARWLRIHLPIQETQVQSLSGKDPTEKEMVTHSSILAWEIPWQRNLAGYIQEVTKSWTWLRNWTTKYVILTIQRKNHLIISLDVERTFNKFQIYSW